METEKYKVADPRKLKSWEAIARKEIYRWLTDEAYEKEVTETTMKNEIMGPFTKFLYHFASMCECGWGVMIDFNEYKQRVFLPDHYYKWMHKLRDEIIEAQEKVAENFNQPAQCEQAHVSGSLPLIPIKTCSICSPNECDYRCKRQ